MSRIHEVINSLVNDFTKNSLMGDISEEVNVFCLELADAVANDLEKGNYYVGEEPGAFMKMNNVEDLRSAAQSLLEKNLELEKRMKINDFFALHALHFHPRTHPRLREVAKLFVETGGRLDPDSLMWLAKNNSSTPELRAEEESIETERIHRLKKLGGIKSRIRK